MLKWYNYVKEGLYMSERIFKTEQEFYNKFIEYIEYCEVNERFVNIAGLCRYLGIHRRRFYDQEEYYPHTFLLIQEILEDETLNNKTTPVPITMLYLKNKFGYKDKIETENTNVNTNKNIDLSAISTEELKKLIDDES